MPLHIFLEIKIMRGDSPPPEIFHTLFIHLINIDPVFVCLAHCLPWNIQELKSIGKLPGGDQITLWLHTQVNSLKKYCNNGNWQIQHGPRLSGELKGRAAPCSGQREGLIFFFLFYFLSFFKPSRQSVVLLEFQQCNAEPGQPLMLPTSVVNRALTMICLLFQSHSFFEALVAFQVYLTVSELFLSLYPNKNLFEDNNHVTRTLFLQCPKLGSVLNKCSINK